MAKSKTEYKTEWKNFWSDENVPQLTKIKLGMEYELLKRYVKKGDKQNFRLFFTRNSKYFPKLSEYIKSREIDETLIDDFKMENLLTQWKISLYFNPKFYKNLIYGAIGLIFITLIAIFIGVDIISIFIVRDYVVLQIVLIYMMGFVVTSNLIYFKLDLRDRDKIFKKINQVHTFIGFLFAVIAMIIFGFMIFQISNLSDPGQKIEAYRLVYVYLIFFLLFAFLNSFSIYSIDTKKKFQYYSFRFINALTQLDEANESVLLFHNINFIYSLIHHIKKLINLTISNAKEIEAKIYESYFIMKIDDLKHFSKQLEGIVTNPKTFHKDLIKFTCLKVFINNLNEFFNNHNIPKISLKRYSIFAYLLDKFNLIEALITIFIASVTAIATFLSLG